MAEESVAVAGPVVVCRKCGAANAHGLVRCEKCRASLRPLALGVISIFGVLGGVLAVAGGFLVCYTTTVDLLFIASVIAIFVGLIQVVLFSSLGGGAYWAWVAAQVLLGFSILGDIIVIGQTAHTNAAPVGLAFGLIHLLLCVVFLGYLHTSRVREFCGASAPQS